MSERSKTPPRYLIRARFEIDGVVERPDVVGAIFGQTSEVLEDEFDFRRLQEDGKIGRINVSLKTEGENSKGWISIPSGLGKKKTAIIGAALETINQVGAYGAEINVKNIKGARKAKRRYVKERAQELVKKIESIERTGRKGEKLSRRFELEKFSKIIDELKGTLKAWLLNKELEKIKETEVKKIKKEIENLENVKVIVFDGIVTQQLAELAKEEGVEYLVGMRERVKRRPSGVEILTLDDF